MNDDDFEKEEQDEKETSYLLSKALRDAYNEATEAYMLQQDEVTLDHLMTERGLTAESIVRARIGYVSEPLPTDGRYRGRFAIPYIVNGDTVAQKFRCAADHHCKEVGCRKYMNEAGKMTRMYGTSELLHATSDIHIAEGEIDAIILRQIGLHAVAFPGATQVKFHQHGMIEKYHTIFVWADPDAAGKTMLRNLQKRHDEVVEVRLTEDVNDTFLHQGEFGLMMALNDARARVQG